MASRFSLEAIFKAVDNFSKPLVKMTNSSSKFTKTLKRDFAQAQRQAMQFSRNFAQNMKRGIQIGIGVAIVGLSALAKKGIELASSLTEVENVVGLVFGEKGRGKINEWSKAAYKNFGISELQAKQFTSTMGGMMKASDITGNKLIEMSTTLSGLSGDIASARDLDPEEVFEKLKSVVTGTVKPMTALGIVMNVANLEAFAMSKGITKSWKSMSQAEKVTLRYNYIMAKTIDMQTDYKRTLDESLANQIRTLKIGFFNKLGKSMIKLIPLLIKGAEFLRGFLDKIDEEKLAGQIEKAALSIIKFAKGAWKLFKILKPFIPLILSLVAGAILYYKALFVIALVQELMAKKTSPLILILAALIFLIFLIVKNWNKFNKTQKIIIITVGILIGIIGTLIAAVIIAVKIFGAWQVAQWLLNVAMNANVIGLIVMGIATLIIAIILLIKYYKEIIAFTTKWWDILKGVLFVLFPMYRWIILIIEVIRTLVKNWSAVKEAFKTGGILGGIIAIGKVLLSAILAPIQSLFNLLAKLPKIGKTFQNLSAGISDFQGGLFEGKVENPMTPSDRSSFIREEKISKGELTIKDQTGKGELNAPKGSDFFIQMSRSGSF